MTIEQFKTDAKTLKAVAAELMIIGEAANHIPDDVQDAHEDVPWVVMRAMRNRVVHVYFDVDPDILWDTVHNDLPNSLPRSRNCSGDLSPHSEAFDVCK